MARKVASKKQPEPVLGQTALVEDIVKELMPYYEEANRSLALYDENLERKLDFYKEEFGKDLRD